MTADKVKVLIVDDSKSSQELIQSIVESDSQFQIIGKAENGAEGVRLALELRPDIVIMDLVMPLLDGFEATQEIMQKCPTRIIALSGVFNREEILQAFRTMQAGALTVLEKPKWISEEQYIDNSRFFIETMKALATLKVAVDAGEQVEAFGGLSLPQHTDLDVIAIGASIGGPALLSQLLSKLPKDYPIPIVVYQHMSAGMLGPFVHYLNEISSLDVLLVQEGEQITKGNVYIIDEDNLATIDQHGVLDLSERGKQELNPIDILFKSIATAYGHRAVALLLKGIGSDGLEGIKAMEHAKGIASIHETVVQNVPIEMDIMSKDRPIPTHTQFDRIIDFFNQLAKVKSNR